MLKQIEKDLKEYSDKNHAKISARFFKTGKGEYGHGDVFMGVKVPNIRKVAKKYLDISLTDLQTLLNSKEHEKRYAALVIMTLKFKKGEDREKIFNLYLKNTKRINNWDLVDISAPHIVGAHIYNNPKLKKVLNTLAKSENLWERRIAVIATHHFVRKGKIGLAMKISKKLLKDKHDLMHKAVGWTLREVGKRNLKALEEFLQKNNYKTFPRTLLRYAIEKLPETKRKEYMKK